VHASLLSIETESQFQPRNPPQGFAMASSTAGAVCSDRVVCRCLQVTESTLIEVVTTHGAQDMKDVRRHTGAGAGCMACHRLIRTYLAQNRYASSSLPSCSER